MRAVENFCSCYVHISACTVLRVIMALRYISPTYVLCSIPSLLERTASPPSGGILLQLYVSGYNTVFLFVVAAFAFGVVRTSHAWPA
jgi:hypothetical protein